MDSIVCFVSSLCTVVKGAMDVTIFWVISSMAKIMDKVFGKLKNNSLLKKKNTKGVILKQKRTSVPEDGEDWKGLEMTILKTLANFFKIHEQRHSSINTWIVTIWWITFSSFWTSGPWCVTQQVLCYLQNYCLENWIVNSGEQSHIVQIA